MERFTLPYPPDLDDWLDLRAPFYNASMAGALFGVHPFETLADVCVQKITGHRVEENDAMRRGTRMEPYILDVACDLLSRKLVKPDVLYGCGPMLATLDAIDPDDPTTHIEIKTTTNWIGSEPEPYWHAQAQAQMGCYGSTTTIFVYLDKSLEVGVLEVYFDPEYFDRLVTRAQAVMSALALGEVPEWVAKEMSGQNVQDLWPQDDGDAVDLPHVPDVVGALLGYQDAGAMKKEWEDRQKEHRDTLTRWIRGHSTAMAGGLEVYTFKAPRPTTRFAMERFAADHPELVEQYTEEVPLSRRLYIKQANLKKLEQQLHPNIEEPI